MKFYLILFLFLCLAPLVSAYTLDYDYYESLNTPSTIKLQGNFTEEDIVAIVYGNEYSYMNKTETEDGYYFDISFQSDVEDDFYFDVYGDTKNSSFLFGYNESDDLDYNLLNIDDDTIYTIKNYHYNHTLEPKKNLVCINIETNNKPRDIVFVTGVRNISDTDNISWFESDTKTYRLDALATECAYVDSQTNLTNHTDYMGFYCSDCKVGNSMNLGILPLVKNLSYAFSNKTANPVQADLDYMISYHDETPASLQDKLSGLIKFRDSFNVDFQFSDINNVSEDYFDNYKYLYLQKIEQESSASSFDSSMEDLLDFSWVDNIMGIESEEELDTEISFWGEFITGVSTIKLYESGNYTLNLVSPQSISSVYNWNEEFL